MNEDLETTVVAIKLGMKALQRTVGLCARVPNAPSSHQDPIHWNLISYEFVDNDQYSNLDCLLVQLAPSKAFIGQEFLAKDSPKGDYTKLLNMLERRKVEAQGTRTSNFKVLPDEFGKELQRLLNDGSLLAQFTNETDRPLATACMSALMKEFALETNDDGSYQVSQGSLDQYVKLDSSAADAVMLLPDDTCPGVHSSVYSVLNRCKTKMGSRMLERWLRQPLKDRTAIESRHDIVGIFLDHASLRTAVMDGPLKKCPDLDMLQGKMRHKKAGLSEIFKLYVFARSLPSFSEVMGEQGNGLSETEHELLTSRFIEKFDDLDKRFLRFRELVENVVDFDILPELSISPTYSPELGKIREEMNQVLEEIHGLHEDARDGWCVFGKDKCLLESDKQRGFVFRLTKANLEKELKSRNAKVETISVLKNGVHFTTPQLRQAGKLFAALKGEYETAQEELVLKALEIAATYLPVMESACNIVAELDVLVGLAHAAALAPIQYVRPVMKDLGSGVLNVKDARHPCLEWQANMDFIPNSYAMQQGKGQFLVVTGPNMGGKSTYIRTIGTIVIMAQIGSYVPAASAEISIIDALFARVGAGDAQQRGISTFMAEMLEASVILSSATERSLIIIDELGRGTSTFDGFGLAWAISEYLVNEVKAMTLFATHFHEMTKLTDSGPCVENWHVTASVVNDSITMLYTVQPGPCLQSFGVHVASMAGFPKSVIHEAKRKAASLENFEDFSGENVDSEIANKKFCRLGRVFKHLPMDTIPSSEKFAFVLKSCKSILADTSN